MEIKYNDHVRLVVDLTPQMRRDYQECMRLANIPGGDGRDCKGCSLDIGVGDAALCELPLVDKALRKKSTP